MKGNFPFKFWCHKVLPLVYDDSISYYEFLCKIAKLVNDISEHNEEQDTAIANNAEHIQKNADDITAETRARDTAIANEESARIRGDYEIGVRLENDELHITDLHNQIMWVAKKFGALPYDKEHSYNVGDFCLFNDAGSSEDSTLIYGNIYRCKESTTGEFDSAKWEMINLLQFVEKIWSETLEPFADKYDEEHTWNVNDIVLYGGDEIYGNTGGMPIIYRCINQTTGAFNYNDWAPLRFSWILDKTLDAENAANNLNTKVFYGFNSIANNYQEYSGAPLFYPKGSYVWYLDILYKANADVNVDSASVLPPNQNSSWDSVTLTDEIGSGGSEDVDLNNIYEAIGVQIDKVGFQINVPKYTIGYTENALNGRQLYYANKDTTAGAGYEPNDWTLLSSVGLYGWVKLITDDISRYSEVLTAPINTVIN